MTSCSLEISFRRGKVMAAYLYVNRRDNDRSDRTVERGPGIKADYTADGRLIGVEFTAPSVLSGEVVRQLVRELNLPANSAEELAPLVRIAASAA